MNLTRTLTVLAALATLAPLFAVADSSSKAVKFAVVVPAMVRVTALAQPNHFAVDESHVAQGYIDIDGASSLLLTSNSRRGYHLDMEYNATLLDRVQVRIADRSLEGAGGSGGMDVRSEKLVDELVKVSYRLYLKPGVRAGSYRWPVSLAFSTSAA